MRRREFMSMLGVGAASLAAAKLGTAQTAPPPATRPVESRQGDASAKPLNFVFIFPDSMGANAVGCYGNALAKSPTIDALAAGGVRFGQCTAQNPLCFPSRASVHTGKYISAHGCRDNGVGLLDPAQPTFARSLREAGYHTGYFGKAHNVNRSDWNEVFDLYADYNNYLRGRGIHVKYPEKMPLADLSAGISRIPAADFSENILGNLGQRYIEDRVKDDKPFFLFMSHEAPHSPWSVPQEDANLYDGVDIPLLDIPAYDWDNKPEWRMRYFRRRVSMATDRSLKKVIATYLTLVNIVDRNIQKLVDTLDRTGLRENTIIIIAADHGDHLGNHRQMGKCLSLDQSLIHVPFIFNCPSRWQPRVNHSMVELIDLFPTVCALAGVKPPSGLQGFDLNPLLAGAQEKVRDFGHSEEHNDAWASSFAVRDGRYKYVRSSGGFQELYDLQNDPHEWRNLAGDSACAAQLDRMQDGMLEWRLHCADQQFPQRNDWVSHFLKGPVPTMY